MATAPTRATDATPVAPVGAGSQAARECGVYEILPQRYPDAVNTLGVHMARGFMGWLKDQGRA